jgi:uncharacterized protein (TIGR02217 family)
MQAFHAVRFPTRISFGATGGPERRNEIVRLTSGQERRNQRFARSRRRYDAGTGLRSIEDLYDVVAFFEARRGSLIGFRFRDPFDWKSCRPDGAVAPTDQEIGAGDGERATFQLVKRYGEGEAAELRPITAPVAGTVRVAVGGAETTTFVLDDATGVVTLDEAPSEGVAVTAGFEFDVPVRFDTDRLEASLSGFRAGQIPNIPLVEIVR